MKSHKIIKLVWITFVFTLTIIARANAQQLIHSIGLTLSVMQGTLHDDNGGSESFALEENNFTYFPRFNFVENENSSISVGAPIGVGIVLVSNTYGDDAGVLFSYDLPLVIDYNIGCRSTMDNDKNFGGYFGVGFGYSKVKISGSSYLDLIFYTICRYKFSYFQTIRDSHFPIYASVRK